MNLDQINDIPDILMEFLEYHSTVRGHSDRTVMAYYTDLKILLRFLKRRRHLVPRDVPFDEIDITDIDIDFIKNIRIEELYKYQSFSPEYIGESRSLIFSTIIYARNSICQNGRLRSPNIWRRKNASVSLLPVTGRFCTGIMRS